MWAGGLVDGDDALTQVIGSVADRVQFNVFGFAAGGKMGGLRDLSGAEDADAERAVSHQSSFQQLILGVRLVVGG